MTGEMLTFHGDPELKRKLLRRAVEHRAADSYKHGVFAELEGVDPSYGEVGTFKGCAIGCLSHDVTETVDLELTGRSLCHRILGADFGLPSELVSLAETVFEGTTHPFDRDWAPRLVEAIPVGATEEFISAIARHQQMRTFRDPFSMEVHWQSVGEALIQRLSVISDRPVEDPPEEVEAPEEPAERVETLV